MQQKSTIAVVAEDQEFCRAGLSSLLKRKLGFRSVLEVRSKKHLDEVLRSNFLISLVTVDLDLPGLDGPNSLRQMRSEHPSVRVAVVTSSATREIILACLAAGIHGFIPKAFQTAEICSALSFIVKGHVFVPSVLSAVEQMREIRNAVDQPLQTDIRLGLTQRQQEVLHLMSKGRSNKEIARALDIAPGTVKVHINAAFRTLGVHNRVSAAAALMAPAPADHRLASLSA
ncbi:response regulator [Allosphingosinicella sp.]|uniref:response regulator n=1 Tax=Allosphingosinicella sp. TaxID=2823234 RepID=UPI002FC1BBB8